MPPLVKRVVIPLLLLVAAASLVGLLALPQGQPSTVDEVVQQLSPGPGDKGLQQGRVSVDLQDGWDGRLQINGLTIPDDEVVRVVEQGQVSFQPGEGRTIEAFPAGQNSAVLTYWPRATPDQTFTRSWCFTVV